MISRNTESTSRKRLAATVLIRHLVALGICNAAVLAQQYCVSGTIRTLNGCTSCGFGVGDLVSFTIPVKPNTTKCSGSIATGICGAETSLAAQINGIRWSNIAAGTGTLSMLTRTDGTTFSFAGIAYFDSITNPIPKGAKLTSTFALNAVGYFPSTLALPAALPTPAMAALNGLSLVGFAVDSAVGTFWYQGNDCATSTSSPSINPGGVVPIYSSSSTIQSGSWVSIFGTNLASAPATWNGDFPTSLAGTSVTINNKPAYLWYVSPNQINLQAPDDIASGTVPVTVTTASGTVTSTVTLGLVGPSFSVLDGKHVAGILLRSDASGLYGGGTYDILGPAGTSLGYQTVPARAGDIVALFGVGFGPTTPPIPAGKPFGGAAFTTNRVSVSINGTVVTPLFAGITGAGLYQINLTVPAGLSGEVPIVASVNGVSTQNGVLISLQ